MNCYLAFYNQSQTQIKAETSYDATLQAIDYFKPPKSKQHMVHVMLCELDGEPVIHTPAF